MPVASSAHTARHLPSRLVKEGHIDIMASTAESSFMDGTSSLQRKATTAGERRMVVTPGKDERLGVDDMVNGNDKVDV